MSDWEYFTVKEMACKHCGAEGMDPFFMEVLETIRRDVGFAMPVTSGYRCPEHPDEKKKKKPGAHAHGYAADIQAQLGPDKFTIIASAIQHGIVGIGVARNFVHLDIRHPHAYRPGVWGYS